MRGINRMITIKSNAYSKNEISVLLSIFSIMENQMQTLCKQGETCKTCENRHICYDITSAKEHLIKLNDLQ